MDLLGSYDSDDYSSEPEGDPTALDDVGPGAKMCVSDHGVRYWLSLPPADRRPAAIVVALHGTAQEWCMGLVDAEGNPDVAGAMGALASWGPEGALQRYRAGGDGDACGALLAAECIVITPLAPVFPWPVAALRNLAMEVAEQWNGDDRSRVYAVGASFGGHAVWSLAIDDARRAARGLASTADGRSAVSPPPTPEAAAAAAAATLDPFQAERDVRVKEGRLGGGQVMTMNEAGKLVPLPSAVAAAAAAAAAPATVMPFLLLGRSAWAADAAALAAKNVVLCLDADAPSAAAAPGAVALGAAAPRTVHLDLPCDDDGGAAAEDDARVERIVATFKSSYAAIHAARQRSPEGAVLVHCSSAVSASAAVAAAFMMQWRGWGVARAAAHLLGRCKQAHPSPLYTRALFHLERALPHTARLERLPQRASQRAPLAAAHTPFFAALAVADGWMDPEERRDLGCLDLIARARRPLWVTHSAGCAAVAPAVAIDTIAELRAAYAALSAEHAACADDVLRHSATAASSNAGVPAAESDRSGDGSGTTAVERPFLEQVELYTWLLEHRASELAS